MFRIALGEPYDPSVTEWPEGSLYCYDTSGHWILILYQKPTEMEIRSVQEGVVNFALYVQSPVIFLLHQFGQMAWHDCPYSWWKVPLESRSLPDTAQGYHALVKTALIDASTGIVRGLRVCTFSSHFTSQLHMAIRTQAQSYWTDEEHDKVIRSAYRTYSPEEMAEKAEIACMGGD